LDANTRAKLEQLRLHAEANRKTVFELEQMEAGLLKPIGADPRHVLKMGGMTVIFAIEEDDDGKWFRHVSVSVGGDEPRLADVDALLPSLGYENRLGSRQLTVFPSPNYGWAIVNVTEDTGG